MLYKIINIYVTDRSKLMNDKKYKLFYIFEDSQKNNF